MKADVKFDGGYIHYGYGLCCVLPIGDAKGFGWLDNDIYHQSISHCETGYFLFYKESDDIRDNIYVIHGTVKKFDLLDAI